MSEQKLTILLTPLDAWGHINACFGLAQELKERGHRVVWALDRAFRGKLEVFGFEEEIHEIKSQIGQDGVVKEYWPQFIQKYCHLLLGDPSSLVENYYVLTFEKMLSDNKERDPQFKEIISRVKPDVIISDNYICSPAITNSGIPWVWMYSATPHFGMNDERIPPAYSGLPLSGDRKEWEKFRELTNKAFAGLRKEVNDYCLSEGAPPVPTNRLHPLSPYLNIYLYVKELDYEEIQPLTNNWIRVEDFVRITDETFEIPAQLQERPGKLIFLSMGSFGCANLALMQRLTAILAKSQHKFIVSKGPVFESHKLPDNMWGQRFLPQTAILPLVDLVITHGGNNTVTESFYFGKPMLVLPLFFDQIDNGQRIEETGLGRKLNPFHCSEDELLNAVDRLVADESLAQRMTAIGERVRESNDKKVVADRIERIFESC